MASRIGFITIDCAAPDALATFWCEVLGHEKKHVDERWARIGDRRGGELQILFQSVPENKITKNRVHIDLLTEDLAAEVERIRDLGAAYLETRAEHGMRWAVMTDPEGNEFCVAQVEA